MINHWANVLSDIVCKKKCNYSGLSKHYQEASLAL